MAVTDYVSLISLAIAVFAFIDAFITRQKSSATKSYAAERDFQHLKRNQEQMQQNQAVVLDQIEELETAVRGLSMKIDYWLGRPGKEEN